MHLPKRLFAATPRIRAAFEQLFPLHAYLLNSRVIGVTPKEFRHASKSPLSASERACRPNGHDKAVIADWSD